VTKSETESEEEEEEILFCLTNKDNKTVNN